MLYRLLEMLELLTDVKVKICADTKLEIGCTIYIDVPVGSNVWL
jgi:hypothetical protein